MLAQYKTAALALTGIQHLWMLDETSGTSAADSQGSTTLTWGAAVSGFLTTGPDGVASVPVNDGNTNKIAVNTTGFTPPATATYFFWMRYDTSANDDGMVFELINASNTQYVEFDYNYSGSDVWVGGTAGKAWCGVLYDGVHQSGGYCNRGTTGQWDFYCVTVDPAAAATSQVQIYRTAALVSTGSSPSTAVGTSPPALKVGLLGRNTRTLPIKAAMCGFGLTNTLLSTTEMTSLRSAMLSGTPTAMPIAPAPLRALIGR